MSKQLRQEIEQQVARIGQYRTQVAEQTKIVKRTLANPLVLASGVVGGFFIGYFLRNKNKVPTQNNRPVTTPKRNSKLLELQGLLSSPWLLILANLLKK